MLYPFAIAVFAAVFFSVLAFYFLLGDRLSARRRTAKARLEKMSADAEFESEFVLSILRDDSLSSIPLVHRVLSHFDVARKLQRRIDQAGVSVNVGSVALAMGSLAGLFFLIAFQLGSSLIMALPAAALGFLLPLGYLSRKRSNRIHSFEALLPDALDIIVNALRAGFSFESALIMVAQEIPDPLGIEFAIMYEEQNLGVELSDALFHLRERVPSEDLDLVITAIVIHKRTGGSLAEVLDKTAGTVRERFKFQGEVRTKTAHGRYSGAVLLVLPVAVVGITVLINPDYFMTLINEKIGHYLLGGALLMQLLGIWVIRKIVNIRI